MEEWESEAYGLRWTFCWRCGGSGRRSGCQVVLVIVVESVDVIAGVSRRW